MVNLFKIVPRTERTVAELLNVHFNNITKSLNLFEWNPDYCSELSDSVERAIV